MKAAFEETMESYTPNSEMQNRWTGPKLPKSEEKEQERWDIQMRYRLKASQEAWLRYRETACAAVQEMYDGGTMTEVAVPLCKVDLTRERTKFLLGYFRQNN